MKLALALVLLAACDRAPKPEPQPEPARPRRVIEPPPGVVRALPPHAIRAGNVGPYKLGERLSEILDRLPSGPRMVLFEVPGLVHASLIRADDNAVLVGGEQGGTASWVAVVGAEVARTESGIHVGSTRAELIAALGAPAEDLDHARDPRLIVPSTLRSARIVIDDDKVAAIAVLPEVPPVPAPATPPRDDCPRPPSTERAIGACLTGVGELVEVADGNEITLRLPDAEKSLAAFRVPNVVFAAPLRAADGRDELVVVVRASESGSRSWSILGFRFDGGKISRSIEPTPLYQVTDASARLIGAEAKDIDLYLDLTGKPDAIEVGGLLTTRPAGAPVRDLAVISTVVTVERRRGRAADAGAGSAGSGSAGSAGSAGSGSGSAGTGSDRAKP